LKLLLHVCCAPCLCVPLEAFREDGWEVIGYFYNPNVHPLLEFRRRAKALHVFLETDATPMVFCEDYGLREFLARVESDRPQRCLGCYELRLRAAARRAMMEKCDAYSSTLLVSPMQQHESIRAIGERVAGETGLPFHYRDLRERHDTSLEIAKRRMLYRQTYCGCIFSEQERYEPTTRHLYRGAQ